MHPTAYDLHQFDVPLISISSLSLLGRLLNEQIFITRKYAAVLLRRQRFILYSRSIGVLRFLRSVLRTSEQCEFYLVRLQTGQSTPHSGCKDHIKQPPHCHAGATGNFYSWQKVHYHANPR